MLLDAHIHLQDCDDSKCKDFFARAQQEGVSRFLCNATKPADWRAVHDLAQVEEAIVPCYGVHPWFIGERSTTWETTLINYLQENGAALVGEIGLDSLHGKDSIDEQRIVFEKQVEIACDFERPFVVHCVGAWGLFLEVLRHQSSLPRFMVHYYSGSRETACEVVALGGYISFATNILDDAKQKVQNVLRAVPRERLLLETDYPYVSHCVAHDSSYAHILKAIYKKAAAVRKVTEKELNETVYHNGTIFAN